MLNGDKIRNHYKDKLNAEPRIIHVPEWDIDIYVYTPSLAIRDKLWKALQQDGLVKLVDVIMIRSMNNLRYKLFDEEDRNIMLNEGDSELIARVAAEIMTDMQDATSKDELDDVVGE